MARRRFPYPVQATAGPFVGVRTVASAPAADLGFAQTVTNGYPEVGEYGTSIRLRPPFLLASIAGALGQVGSRVPQGIYQAPQTDGTVVNLVFCGGKMYRVTTPTTVVDITPAAGVTIDSSARRVWAVPFLGALVVSDGVNRPWLATNLTATPCTGTYLTDVASAWDGPPAVYYGKVFGFRDGTLEWSEEADAHTGYANATYDNTWVLAQTSTSPIVALAATDGALYVFRRDSITAIAGAVTKDFTTSGVRDAVHPTLGTVSAASVVLGTDDLWFRGTDRRVYRLPFGGRPEPVWRVAVDAHESATAAEVATEVAGAYHTGLSLVLIGSVSGGLAESVQVFDATTRQYAGTWTGPEKDAAVTDFGAMGMLWSATERQQVLYYLTSAGHLFYSRPRDNNWQTAAVDAPVYSGGAYTYTGIAMSVQAPPIAADPTVQVQWDRVRWIVRTATSGKTVSAQVGYSTHNATGAAQTVTATSVSTLAGSLALECGVLGHGRWIAPSFSILSGASGATDRTVVWVEQVAVEGVAVTDRPGLA